MRTLLIAAVLTVGIHALFVTIGIWIECWAVSDTDVSDDEIRDALEEATGVRP